MPETRGLCLSEEQTISTVRFLRIYSFRFLQWLSFDKVLSRWLATYLNIDLRTTRFQSGHGLGEETTPWKW